MVPKGCLFTIPFGFNWHPLEDAGTGFKFGDLGGEITLETAESGWGCFFLSQSFGTNLVFSKMFWIVGSSKSNMNDL